MENEENKKKNEVKEEEKEISSADTQAATTPSEPEGEGKEIEETEEVIESEDEPEVSDVEEPVSQPEELSEPEDATVGEGTNESIDESEPIEEEPVENDASLSFTPEQQALVNKLVGSAREEGRKSAINELVKQYGLDNIDMLADIMGKSQQFDYINGEYENASKELEDYRNRDMLQNANIIPEKFDDVKAVLKYKGLPITVENITAEVTSHPEWIKVADKKIEEAAKPVSPFEKAVIKSKEELLKPSSDEPSIVSSTTNDTTNSSKTNNTNDELAEVRAMYNLK